MKRSTVVGSVASCVLLRPFRTRHSLKAPTFGSFCLLPKVFERGLFESGTGEFRSGLVRREKRAFGRSNTQGAAEPGLHLNAGRHQIPE